MRSDARANRDRILDAAEAVFGDKGASGSTEDVARRAGVGIGTVFRHFPTKQSLLEATVVRHFEQLTLLARERATSANPDAAVRDLIEAMLHGTTTKITLLTLLADGGDVPESAATASRELRAAVGTLLRRAQRAGAVRHDVSVDELYLLIRALSHAANLPTKRATMRKALTVVLDGLAPRQ
jgi:AcrR family transcriptional regulator